MDKKRRWLRGNIAAFLLAVGIFLLLPSLDSGFVYRACQDLDINSGRIRQRSYLFGLCVHDSVQETGMSCVVSGSENAAPADWRATSYYTPLGFGTHCYHFGGAAGVPRMLEEIWSYDSFTSAAKAQMAREVISCWHHDQPWGGRYLDEVFLLLDKRAKSHATMPIDCKDLPKPQAVLGP